VKLRSAINLIKKTTSKSFKKGDVLIPDGSVEKTVMFIRRGLVRSFVMDIDKLEEITFQLYPENSIAINLHSILFDEPSKFTYKAIEDTKVYQIDYSSFLELSSNDSELLELNRKYIGKKAMKQAFQRIESFVFLTPEERYVKFVKDYPKVVNRTPDKYIANVLGITPVSLSRIRSRLTQKKR